MLLSCQTLDVLYAFYIFFGTNLLTQCQVPVPVFSMLLTPFRGDFETESKRKKIPEFVFRHGRRSGSLRAKAGEPQGPHNPPPRGQGEAAAHRLVGPLSTLYPSVRAYIFPKNTKKNQEIIKITFSPPQASVSARSHLGHVLVPCRRGDSDTEASS